MVKVRARPESGNLYFDFSYRGLRCREQTTLVDTTGNRRTVEAMARRIDRDIRAGRFDYTQYFPDSPRAHRLASQTINAAPPANGSPATDSPTFREFSETWFVETEPRWRSRYRAAVRDVLDKHLLPTFGSRALGDITRADILAFRAAFAKRKGRRNATISARSTNKVVGIFKRILNEGCDRFGLVSPAHGIKPLRQKRPRIMPFTLDEVNLLIATVRPDYRAYLVVRFFTGLRTAEVNGLQWQDVNLDENTITVERSYSRNGDGELKTEGSHRILPMVPQVRKALEQQIETRIHDVPWVFHSRRGNPIDAVNFTNRVWYPLLRLLDLPPRRPYETRHTAATLMLASGENPEWVARLLGHSTTEMLFRVYSRYIPNLTRNDGRAFAHLLQTRAPAPKAPQQPMSREQLEDLSADELRTMLLNLPEA